MVTAQPIAAIMVHVASVAEALAWYARAFPGAMRSGVGSPDFEFLNVDGVRLEFVPSDEKVASG